MFRGKTQFVVKPSVSVLAKHHKLGNLLRSYPLFVYLDFGKLSDSDLIDSAVDSCKLRVSAVDTALQISNSIASFSRVELRDLVLDGPDRILELTHALTIAGKQSYSQRLDFFRDFRLE